MEDDGQRLLQRILDGAEDPTDLPLQLLKDITDNFSEKRIIGRGGFGDVYKGVLGERNIAVKRIHINENTIDGRLFRREFVSLWNSNHRNIVRFLGFCSSTHQKTIEDVGSGEVRLASVLERLLCFEYISNGSLDKHITDELRGLEWESRYEIIIGICKGLRYLHKEKNIIHMDLKPSNILLHRQDEKYMVPKITDFGLSRLNENSHTVGTRFGTRGYMAPEYEKYGKTTLMSDIYSLGVIIIELVTGCTEVPNSENVLRRWRHRWHEPPTQLRYQQVTRCMEIAGRCRAEQPEARPSISKIISFLSESKSTHCPIIPCLDKDDMLRINPLELLMPSELNNQISHSIELSNDTVNCIAFNIQSPSAQAVKGIVQPGCTYAVIITVQARDVGDKIIVKSMKCTAGLGLEDIIEYLSRAEAHRVVDEVNLMVVYEPKEPQENCKPTEDTNMPAEEVPEAKKRKIIKSSFGKGKNILGSSKNSEATSMDINSSAQRPCNLHPLQSFSRHYPTERKYLVEDSDRAVDLSRGAMGSLLHKLGNLVTEDYSLEMSIKTDIESLSEDLTVILRDLPEMENVKGAKIWVDDVRELSYHIEDMVDRFLVHVEPDSNSGGFRELKHEGIKLWENGMMTHHQIGDVIRDIKNLVQVLARKKHKYNLNAKNVEANATAKASIEDLRNLPINIGVEQLIGIEAPRDELINLLEEDGNISKHNLKIISIVGLGGLGKTTLAKAVYENLTIANNYTRAFVPVGQNPVAKEVLKNIISAFENYSNAENLQVWQLREKLQNLLKNKRYFIVIDDIWDPPDWESIRSAFPENKCGSRVITTTRNHDVALACCHPESKYVYWIKPLNKEDSKRLFFRRTCRTGNDCPDRIKDISVDILKTCSGMPLAINSIASLLRGKEHTTWEYVWKSLGALTEGKTGFESMKQILDLSYIHLPDYLKTCLLYVCKYPEDREIYKNDLLRQWIAEGFVHVSANSRLDAEDVAEDYFQKLISMCMIQPAKIDYYSNEVLSCRVHDIILDLIKSKSAELNFIHVIDGPNYVTEARRNIRRVSVQNIDKEDRIWDTKIKGSLACVRSLYTYSIVPISFMPHFLEFKYIRVVELLFGGFPYRSLDLTGIGMLCLLRYLKIQVFMGKVKLPDRIAELQQLETIYIDGFVENYPSDIVSLPRLSYLSYGGGAEFPDGIGRLKSLRSLECAPVNSVDNIKGLGELTNLRILDLSSYYHGESKEEKKERENALHSSISRLSASLRILTLNISPTVMGWSSTPFSPGSLIRKLDLYFCHFERCPEWIGQLHYLYSLSINVGEVADGISIVGGLPALAYFRLCVNKTEEKEESVVIPGIGAFRALKHLILECTSVCVLTFEERAMPKLEKLAIRLCYKITRRLAYIPVGVEHLPAPSLKEISLTVTSVWDNWDNWKVKGSENWNQRAWYKYWDSDHYADKIKEHARKTATLLKSAFKLHHPSADINVNFANYDYSDSEDVDEENYEEDGEDAYDDEDYYNEENN